MDNTATSWFTLTELQERLNRDDRQQLLDTLRAKGFPMAAFGREVLIATDSFIARIHELQETGKPLQTGRGKRKPPVSE